MNAISERLVKALHIIETEYESIKCLDDLARRVNISKFHFHRLFAAQFGLSASDYLRKHKLHRAAFQLVHTNRSIIDIAISFNFKCHESFIRAFKRAFQKTPSLFRKQFQVKNNSLFQSRKWMIFQKEFDLSGPNITELNPISMIGFRYVGSYEHIHQGWIRFLYEMQRQKLGSIECLKWMIHHGQMDWVDMSAMRIDLAIECDTEQVLFAPIYRCNTVAFRALKFDFYGDLLDLPDVYAGIFSLYICPKQSMLADLPIMEAYDSEKVAIYIPILD